MAEHTPEPWHYGGLSDGYLWDEEETVCIAEVIPEEEDEPRALANAARIAACVNALAGVPTAAVEGGAVARLVTAARKLTTRDGGDLAADMEGLRAALSAFPPAPESEPT